MQVYEYNQHKSLPAVVQLISGYLSNRGKPKKQTDQSSSLYMMTFQYSLHLIGQFGFSFFCNGKSSLKQTALLQARICANSIHRLLHQKNRLYLIAIIRCTQGGRGWSTQLDYVHIWQLFQNLACSCNVVGAYGWGRVCGCSGQKVSHVTNLCLCIRRPPTLPRPVRVTFYMVPMSIFQCVCVCTFSFSTQGIIQEGGSFIKQCV